MSSLDSVWAATQADSNFDEKNPPPAGYVGIVRITDYRCDRNKKGELYFAVDIKDDQQGYTWGIYKQFTKNGQPHEGSIKSAKITLRQLGIEVQSPSQLEPLLRGIVGRYYSAEQRASDRLNTVTGMPYTNTEITGVASPPTQVGPAPVPQAPAYTPTGTAYAPTQVQTPQGVAAFPSAVSQAAPVQGPTLDQALTGQPQAPHVPGSQFGDAIPWENPPAVAPSPQQGFPQGQVQS